MPPGAAFANIREKTGRNNSGRPAKVPEVETLPCPAGGLHVLVNRDRATACAGCLETWAELDAKARAR